MLIKFILDKGFAKKGSVHNYTDERKALLLVDQGFAVEVKQKTKSTKPTTKQGEK